MDRNVLIVDDDAASRGRVREALVEQPVEVREADDAARALELARSRPPDLLLTELELPDVTGIGLIRLFREEPSLAGAAVIVVTRFPREVDRIVAFEHGVDDYVTKPFFPRELAGRVRAVLRRAEATERTRPGVRARSWGELSIDPDARVVTVRDRAVSLTPREFDLLSTLMEEAGHVLSRDRLLKTVWGDDSEAGHRSVDTHVKTIRRKLGAARDSIETVRGVGYRFSDR
jgi:DNA-binding response OmpR family regulator